LAARAVVILIGDSEIALQQIENGKVRSCLSMRDREGLEDQPSVLRGLFELIEQPRLSDPGLRNRSDDLTVARARTSRHASQMFHFNVSPHESRQSAAGRAMKPRAQWPYSNHFVGLDRIAHAFDSGVAERLELEVSGDQV